MVDGNKLNSVMEFTCIGSTISSNGCIDDEMQRRMAKSSAYSANYARDSGSITMCPCGLNARHIALSTLLYGAEAWTVSMTGEQAAWLHDATYAFDHEENLDGQSDKQGHTRNDRAAIYKNLLIKKNLRWTGHLMRLAPDKLAKRILYSQLSSGHRKRGRPRLRFKNTIKRNLKMRDIKIDSWTSLLKQID